ncbi:T9SS type A sorting domain-containing protein [Pedobacter sp. ASV28]|uniref:T9SS type A sorting domain-containing protein n=1 Tax=Pedobacter sp. ASV28 TaxID=2795123 RepID=UPI0018EAEF07|nr:T9SS type A sorting domain-containing protein [Pedobacter sp. ASV28]
MKKLLLCLMLASTSFISFSQTVPLTTNWSILSGNPSFTSLGLSNAASIAYDGTGHKLYVADRNAPQIKILQLNPLNLGNYTISGNLTIKADWLGTFKFNKIRVATDGAIYATSLYNAASATTAGKLYIYRWENDADTEPSSFELNVTGRFGDALAVYGTGANTKIYVGGSGTGIAPNNVQDKMLVLGFDVNNKIVVQNIVSVGGNNFSRGSISPISDTEIIINGPQSVGIRKIKLNPDYTIADTKVLSSTVLDALYSNAQYFESGIKKYIVLSGSVIGSAPASNIGVRMRVVDVTSALSGLASSATLSSSAELYSETPAAVSGGSNPNGYADVVIRKNADGTHTFFHLVYGHGLASYTTDGTLPVSLSSFNAALVKGESTLTWSTASETNNKGFEVLRSTDGKSFSVVDFVASKAANGNSSTSLNYSYVDRKAQSGISYYRLKQIDLNGTSELFDQIKSVNLILNATAVQVYPNPATSYVKVKTSTTDFKNLKYDLFDLNGKLVLSEKGKDTEQELSLKGLAPSVYYLKVSTNTEQKMVKIIKN